MKSIVRRNYVPDQLTVVVRPFTLHKRPRWTDVFSLTPTLSGKLYVMKSSTPVREL